LRAAAEIDGRAEPHLNLSLIASERGDFESAQRHGARARGLDPGLVEAVRDRAGLPAEARLELVDVPPSRLWRELYELEAEELGATRAQLWRWVGGRVEEWSIPAWGLFSLALGVLGFRIRHRSAPCVRCGAPSAANDTGQCQQCASVFGGSRAVAPSARARKEREVWLHRLRRRWLERAAALVPGLGSLFAGRTLLGFAELLVFSWVLALVWVREAVGLHGWRVPGDGSGGAVVFLAAATGVGLMSLLSLRRAFTR
jgi:hypothetical protein